MLGYFFKITQIQVENVDLNLSKPYHTAERYYHPVDNDSQGAIDSGYLGDAPIKILEFSRIN